MEKKSCTSSKNNGLVGQFKSLNNNEMINLRGGGVPPLPPPSGEDFPIDWGNKADEESTVVKKTLTLPVVPAAQYLGVSAVTFTKV